jgi:crossover junction endodeoxyribonuclease RuvC
MKVIGLDLSLASTGIACSLGWVDRYQPRLMTGMVRLRAIRDWCADMVGVADLVVVEGLSFASQTGQHLTRAGMWHIVMEEIDAGGTPWAEVPPTTLKKYATGRGNAGKDEVLAAVIRRFPTIEVRGNDEADALVLAAMGADHLGAPMVEMPAVNRAALKAVKWPEFAERGAA